MRIGIEARYLLTAEKTGVEEYTAGLTAALADAESAHELVLYVDESPDSPELEPYLRRPRVQVRVVPRRRLWLKLWLPLAARRDGVKVMLYPGSIVSTVHPFWCVPVIHDLCWAHYPQFYPRREQVIFSRVFPKSLARAAAVLVPSQQTKRDVVATYRYPEERITVVPVGRDPAYHPVPEAVQLVAQAYGLDPGYILGVGTSHPRKNIATLIEAYAQVVGHGVSAPLVLAGPGDTTYLREVAARASVADRIHWLGYAAREMMPALYTACGVFASPSYYEGFGIPVLEAMSCGAPVVCARAGSLPEVTGEAALLVDPANAADLAQALESVLTDPDRAKTLSLRGRERAQHFDWTESARAALAALEGIGTL